jgi:uncharacterized repeat protein (TIGR03803 family)
MGWCALLCGVALALILPPGCAHANRFIVLHDFNGGSDGAHPTAVLLRDKSGNLDGTTTAGGDKGCGGSGCGTVFELAPGGAETVLHVFKGGAMDGAVPMSGLIEDTTGNLYGTTNSGGGTGCSAGCGIVFKIAPDGTETVLHTFTDGSDGAQPFAGLIKDKAVNLFGVAAFGGAHSSGVVFKITPDGSERVLYAFKGGSDGAFPQGGLIKDNVGNLYGTTSEGGDGDCRHTGCGTVFKLAPDGTKTQLYAFKGGAKDGDFPLSSLIADAAGNFYTTVQGGAEHYGAVFRLAPDGTATLLHSFTGGIDGADPFCSLILDESENLYGTAVTGGKNGDGVAFRLAADGTETELGFFHRRTDGMFPMAGLNADKKAHLYGTTYDGGAHNAGTIFRLEK